MIVIQEKRELIVARILLAVVISTAVFSAFPQATFASSSRYSGEVAGWIPWWSDTEGLKSATKNIRKLDTVYPFAFEVGGIDATITDKADLSDRQWTTFFRLAKKYHVEVIPSIAWFDGVQIDYVLSDPTRRAAHIQTIVDLVNKGRFDGINIDYEQKDAKTITNFSLFLKELNDKLGRKLLTCTVEARTPAVDLYKVIPSPLLYANDYKAIGQYCDRVELMTYDQQLADLTLNAANSNLPYTPVADNAWVEKVVKLAVADIPADKIQLGIATYGRAWDITVTPTGYINATRVATLNVPRIKELSETVYKTPIGHTIGGEAVMSYFPEDSPYRILTSLSVPAGTPTGFENVARAKLFATLAKMNVKVRFVTFDDADSAEDKMSIADKYDLAGVAFFKIDGEEDQAIWDLI